MFLFMLYISDQIRTVKMEDASIEGQTNCLRYNHRELERVALMVGPVLLRVFWTLAFRFFL